MAVLLSFADTGNWNQLKRQRKLRDRDFGSPETRLSNLKRPSRICFEDFTCHCFMAGGRLEAKWMCLCSWIMLMQ